MKEAKRESVMRKVSQILVQAKVDISTIWKIPLLDENEMLTADEMRAIITKQKNRKHGKPG